MHNTIRNKRNPLVGSAAAGGPLWISNRSCSSARVCPQRHKTSSGHLVRVSSAPPPFPIPRLAPRRERGNTSCRLPNRGGQTTIQKPKPLSLSASARRRRSAAPRPRNNVSWRKLAKLKLQRQLLRIQAAPAKMPMGNQDPPKSGEDYPTTPMRRLRKMKSRQARGERSSRAC